MEDLTSYYRNLCEELQQQIDLIEKKIEEKKKAKKKLPPKGKKKGEEEKAGKDYDGDGKVESGKAEYFGSKDKAIKKAMAKKKAQQMNEGRSILCQGIIYGGFPRLLKEANGGEVDAFQDSPSQGQLDVATKRNEEEIPWSENLNVYGTPVPSKSFGSAFSSYRGIEDMMRKGFEKDRTMFGGRGAAGRPGGFEGSEEHKKLLGAWKAAEAEMQAHPHYGEFSMGHPSKRMAKLSDEEAAQHELEAQYGTSYTLDPTTRKPVYGPRNPRGLGT